MLNGNNNENGKKIKRSNLAKKTTLHLQRTIFVHFFTIVLLYYRAKLSSLYTFY